MHRLSEVLFRNKTRLMGESDIQALDSICDTMDRLDSYRLYCELCVEENVRRESARLDKALAELGGKLK